MCWHKWSKWSEPEKIKFIPEFVTHLQMQELIKSGTVPHKWKQQRECGKCGMVQDRYTGDF